MRNHRIGSLARLGLTLMLLNLAACSSMRTVSVESAMRQSPPPGVYQGSLVEVKTLDDRSATFRVTEITDAGIGGEPGFFLYQDMRSLKVEKPPQSNNQALSIILGLVGLAALVALIANADDVRVCSGTPCPEPRP